jgi:hypothetical protein
VWWWVVVAPATQGAEAEGSFELKSTVIFMECTLADNTEEIQNK